MVEVFDGFFGVLKVGRIWDHEFHEWARIFWKRFCVKYEKVVKLGGGFLG